MLLCDIITADFDQHMTSIPSQRAAIIVDPKPSESNSDEPLVSIIMPMLNEERYIGQCLDSVLAQNFDMARVEILIVDGGSRDQSCKIVAEYAARNSNLRLLHNPFRYQAQALNIAIPQSRGRYVLRMDVHSKYADDYIREIVRAFEETGAENVAGPNISQPGANTNAAMSVFLVQASRLGGGASFGRQEGGRGRFLTAANERTSGWSFRRDSLDKVGPFDERLVRNQDNEYSCRLRRMGGRVWFEPKARSWYFARATVRKFLMLMYRNGFYHMLTWRVSPGSFSLNHCAPAALVASLAGLAAGSWFWPQARMALAFECVLYFAVVFAECARVAIGHGLKFAFWLAWLIPMTHMAYGLGTLLGVLRFALSRTERTDMARRLHTSATAET